MTQKSVAIRLGTTGKAEVTRTFEEIAQSGDAMSKRLVSSFKRGEETALAGMRQQASAAAKIAAIMPQTAVQMRIADTNGTGFGEWERSAKRSALAFTELYAEQERLEAKARALIGAIDPAAAAQNRFNREIAEARALVSAGLVSLDQYAAKLRMEQTALDGVVTAEKRHLAVQAQLEQRARALVAAIDPAAAAQDRFNAEMVEAKTLIGAGQISLDQYCAKLRQEQAALDAATAAGRRHAASNGQLRSAMQGLSFQAQDTFTQISMGANLFSVIAIQGGQLAGQFANVEGKAGSFARFMIGPWGLAITGGMLVLGALTKGLFDNEEAAKKAEDAMGKFQTRQSDIENFIDRTTGALKEQNRTLILNATLTRQAQLAANEKAIAESRDKAFERARDAQFRIGQSAPGSATVTGLTFRDDGDVQRVIREARGDVAKLADGLAALAKTRPGLAKVALDVSDIAGQAIVAARENADLQKELRALGGDTSALAQADRGMLDARARLAGATGAADRAQAAYTISIREAEAAFDASNKTAADQERYLAARTAAERKLNEAQDANRSGDERRQQTLARSAAAMDVSAGAALRLAEAYLAGGDAAIRAEAARKGGTDAARRGIDAEAQSRRQLAIMVGEDVAAGAKSVAQLRDQTAARAAVRAEVLAGTLPFDRMNEALADELALRPLLKLQTLAQGDALATLTKVIEAYRTAMRGAREDEAKDNALRATTAAVQRTEDIKDSLSDLALSPADQARNAARRAAVREADRQSMQGGARDDFLKARREEAEAGVALESARFVDDTLRGQREGLAIATEELRLVAANDNVRDAALSKMRLIFDLKRAGIDLDGEEGRLLVRRHETLSRLVDELERQRAAWEEITSLGGELVETVLSPDTWEDWGEGGKRVIGMLKSELIKLALINPIKNMLFGESNVTLGSVIGSLGRVFGGGAPGAAGASQGFVGPPGNAAGTHYWSGGATLVGEHGSEIVDLPRGARVTPAGETRRLIGANDGGPGPASFHFDLRGAVVTQDLLEQMNAIGASAAVRGAAGGAQLGYAETKARAGRKLGRRW